MKMITATLHLLLPTSPVATLTAAQLETMFPMCGVWYFWQDYGHLRLFLYHLPVMEDDYHELVFVVPPHKGVAMFCLQTHYLVNMVDTCLAMTFVFYIKAS